MNENDKMLVNEDVQFIGEYLGELLTKHPELLAQEKDLFVKMQRRLRDIDMRTKES